MTIECRYEALDCRYEAWRNFMLILAGLLVVDCFARFSEIETAIISLTQFDKTFGTNLWPKLLALMVVIYVTKNAHGIIITLFDEEYVKRIKGSITQSVLFYVFTSMVILSFLLVIHLVNVVENKTTLLGRSFILMFFTLFPNVILLLFDLIHHFYLFKGGEASNFRGWLRAMGREVKRKPKLRTQHQEYKRIWVLEDASTVCVIFIWLALFVCINSSTWRLTLTVGVYGSLLLINSLFDYWMNCNYFFFSARSGGAMKQPAGVVVKRMTPTEADGGKPNKQPYVRESTVR